MRNSRRWLIILYLALMAAGFAITRAINVDLPLVLSSVQAHLLSGQGNAGFAAAYVLALGLCAFLSLPVGPLFYLAGGYLFGVVEGTLLAACGNALGVTAAGAFVRTVLPGGNHFAHYATSRLVGTLVLLRLSPWFPAPLITVFCGVTQIPHRVAFFATVVGTGPLICAYALVASRLRGPLDISVLKSPDLLFAIALLGVLSLTVLLEPLRLTRHVLGNIAAAQAQPAAAQCASDIAKP